jgi:hypothetical protein
MVDVFEKNICNYCKSTNCNKKIMEGGEYKLKTYKCLSYIKDEAKIVPVSPPIYITANRDYVRRSER